MHLNSTLARSNQDRLYRNYVNNEKAGLLHFRLRSASTFLKSVLAERAISSVGVVALIAGVDAAAV